MDIDKEEYDENWDKAFGKNEETEKEKIKRQVKEMFNEKKVKPKTMEEEAEE